jgi:hypothetical protein
VNTARAKTIIPKTSHEPKRAEFLEFCDKVYGFLPFGQKQQVCLDKAIRYMMYIQKKRGGKRDSSDNSKDKSITSEYEGIFSISYCTVKS